MPVMVDTSLKAKQADLRKGLPETKSFMGGKAHFGMRVDEDVYEAAREENLDMMNGGNIWDEPEFRNDMARRHPELLSPLRKKTFVVNPSERQRVASRNRFGKVSTRTWFDGDYKICEGDGLRRYTNRLTGEWRVYDLGSGEMIEEGDGRRPSEGSGSAR